MTNASSTGGAIGPARMSYAEPGIQRFGTMSDLTCNAGLANSDVPLGPANSAYCDITNPQCGGGALS